MTPKSPSPVRTARPAPRPELPLIMTGDQGRGLELAQRFDTGIVHVNGSTMAGEPSLPNGGAKDSGWGRSGHYAIEDFTEVRLTTVTHGAVVYPI